MSLSDAYASVADYATLTRKTTEDDDPEIQRGLVAVSRYIDGRVDRCFGQDDAPVARLFRPESPYVLYIDDLSAAPTSVKVDANGDGVCEEVWTLDQYELLPLNTLVKGEVWPYDSIHRPRWSTAGSFRMGYYVEVTGRWGWPDVPEAVRIGTVELLRIVRLEGPRATQRVNEMDQIIGTSRQAQFIINDLIDRYANQRIAV